MNATCAECGAPMPAYAEWPRLCERCLDAAPVTDAEVAAACRALQETHAAVRANWRKLTGSADPVVVLTAADGTVRPYLWREVA